MRSFEHGRLVRLSLTMGLVRQIARINEMKGKQALYKQQRPQLLETLRQAAVIQSTESSNRIEHIVVDAKRLRDLVAEKTVPQNRSENEVAGYRDVLNTIHTSAQYIRVHPNNTLQLHRDLYKYTPVDGGRWKQVDNVIEAQLPDGRRVVRFQPVPAWQTPQAMEQLCEEHNRLHDRQQVDDLVLIAAFILDFLCIHPFADGNGRMARLMTLLMLYHAGYEVGRFISLERVVEESKETYYDALYASSQGWHEGAHDLLPWLQYFFGVILAAYKEFEGRCSQVETSRGFKSNVVRDAVLRIHQPFTMHDLQNACPGIGLPTIRKVLGAMKDEGLIQCVELGRNAKWVRS